VNLFPEEFLAVVQSAKVLVLSQQLNGRLRAVSIQLGHVQVVNEYDDSLAGRST